MPHVRINGESVPVSSAQLREMDALAQKKGGSLESHAAEVLGLNKPVRKAAKKGGK